MWKQSLTTQTNEFGDIYRIYKSHMFILGGKSERTRKRLRQQRIQYNVIRRQHQNTCWNARSARYGTIIVPSMQNYKLVFKRTWQLLTTQQSGETGRGKHATGNQRYRYHGASPYSELSRDGSRERVACSPSFCFLGLGLSRPVILMCCVM